MAYTTNILVNGPVTVPAGFCSHHTSWPVSGSQPTGLSIGAGRMHDNVAGVCRWYAIETSAGVYSWAGLDNIITQWRTQGWQVTFVIYGTPQFYASAPDQGFTDLYGHAGGAAYPSLDTNLTGFKAFVTALINRYNVAGGAWRVANPTLGKGIQIVECWNEPIANIGRQQFWWGSWNQLTDLCNAAYTTIKALDSATVVTSPSFNHAKFCQQWFESGFGSLYSTIQAPATFDVLCYHSYYGMPRGASYATFTYDGAYGPLGYYQFWLLSNQWCGGKPVCCSEMGWDAQYSTMSLVSITAEAASLRYKLMARLLLTLQAMGCQSVAPYTYESSLCGSSWSTDTNGLMKAYNLAANNVGKTIVSAFAEMDGPVRLAFSSGFILEV